MELYQLQIIKSQLKLAKVKKKNVIGLGNLDIC